MMKSHREPQFMKDYNMVASRHLWPFWFRIQKFDDVAASKIQNTAILKRTKISKDLLQSAQIYFKAIKFVGKCDRTLHTSLNPLDLSSLAIAFEAACHLLPTWNNFIFRKPSFQKRQKNTKLHLIRPQNRTVITQRWFRSRDNC